MRSREQQAKVADALCITIYASHPYKSTYIYLSNKHLTSMYYELSIKKTKLTKEKSLLSRCSQSSGREKNRKTIRKQESIILIHMLWKRREGDIKVCLGCLV